MEFERQQLSELVRHTGQLSFLSYAGRRAIPLKLHYF